MTSRTRAGESALATKRAASSLYGMMSMRSPRSSLTTMRTREPRGPTQAPTGSTPSACEMTAILQRPGDGLPSRPRAPVSRATYLISTRPSAISGTSSSNSLRTSSSLRRERITCGPLVESWTLTMTALMRPPWS